MNVDNEILEKRKNLLSHKSDEFGSGALWKFSQTVGSARYGAVTHPGAKKEKRYIQTFNFNQNGIWSEGFSSPLKLDSYLSSLNILKFFW